MNIIDIEDKKVNINTRSVKNIIKDLRKEFLGGKYKLPDNFKEENYYKACFEFNSLTQEEKLGKYNNFLTIPSDYIYPYSGYNGLYTSTLDYEIEKNKIVLPNIKDKGENLYLSGFLVNRNGKNIDKGIKFLNYILSDKTQMKLYKDYKNTITRFYPVNKNIEDKIKTIEKNEELNEKATKLKEYQLQRIKNGENKPNRVYKEENMKIFSLKDNLYKDIFKLIFSDEEYSDSKLEKKLQELENQYNIYLNE